MEYWDFWSCWDHKGEQILHHSIDHHHTTIFQLLYFFFPIYWPFSITVIWNAHLRFPRFFKTKMFVYIFARFFTWHEIWQNRDGWCSRCGCHQGCCLVNSLMFHGLIASSRKWLHKDYVITVSFTCNRLFKQMFYCWIPNITVQGLFYAECWNSDFLSPSFRAFPSSSLLLELLTWVFSQVLLFNWLILSFLWFSSFFLSLAIMVRWLLPTMDICILFLGWCLVWGLTSVCLDFM